jgi:hypothetical protein
MLHYRLRLPEVQEAAMTDERTEQAVEFLRSRGYVVAEFPGGGPSCRHCGCSDILHEYGDGPTVTRGKRGKCSKTRCIQLSRCSGYEPETAS